MLSTPILDAYAIKTGMTDVLSTERFRKKTVLKGFLDACGLVKGSLRLKYARFRLLYGGSRDGATLALLDLSTRYCACLNAYSNSIAQTSTKG